MDLEKLSLSVCEVARQAGDFMRAERADFTFDKIEVKGHNDFVSYVDKAAEEIIIKGLKPLLPDAGYLTEEETVAREKKRYTWIIDPLDGTTNYVHGLCIYSVSIALAENDIPILGVVFVPATNECFYAWQGGGAYLNGKRINASPVKRVADSLFITGFPYGVGKKIHSYTAFMEYLTFNSHGIRRLGSAAVDLAYAAAGFCDAFYQTDLKPWDMAAGVIIAKEGGATVTDFEGNPDPTFGRSVLASAPGIYNETLELLRKYFDGNY